MQQRTFICRCTLASAGRGGKEIVLWFVNNLCFEHTFPSAFLYLYPIITRNCWILSMPFNLHIKYIWKYLGFTNFLNSLHPLSFIGCHAIVTILNLLQTYVLYVLTLDLSKFFLYHGLSGKLLNCSHRNSCKGSTWIFV